MAAYNYTPDSKLPFINPYHFVPIKENGKSISPFRSQEESEEQHSGVLHCRLIVKTPIIIPDASEMIPRDQDEDDSQSPTNNYNDRNGGNGQKEKNSYDKYPFMTIGNERIIPASSLRGPIRSVYEAASNSCFATMRPDTVITTRAQAEQDSIMSPGLLCRKAGKWSLYTATRYGLSRENYDNFISMVMRKDKVDKQEAEKITYGEKVYYQLKTDENNRKFAVDIKRPSSAIKRRTDQKEGYLCKGEYFENKKYESIFAKGTELKLTGAKKDKSLIIEESVESLKKLLNEYRDMRDDESKRKKLGNHGGYRHISTERFEQDNVENLPIWYRWDGTVLYLSPGCIARYGYKNTLNKVLGEHDVCKDRNKACPACRLFGMIGNKEGAGCAGKVRFSDARPDNESGKGRLEYVDLRELGEPHITYLPFYSEGNKEYDAPGASIAGRKFYWHHQPDRNIYGAQESGNASMNSTMQALYPPDRIAGRNSGFRESSGNTEECPSEFLFDVYYDTVSRRQLQELIWTLCLGDNRADGRMCHKIGHAKPFGFGSVKIVVESREDRTFRRENGAYSYLIERTPSAEGASKKAMDQVFAEDIQQAFSDRRETESFRALMQIMDFQAISGTAQKEEMTVAKSRKSDSAGNFSVKSIHYPVRYGYIDQNGYSSTYKESHVNDLASHQWYSKYRMMVKDDGMKLVPSLPIERNTIPEALVLLADSYDANAKDPQEGNKGSNGANSKGTNNNSGTPGKAIDARKGLTSDEESRGFKIGEIIQLKKDYGFVLPDNTDNTQNNRIFFHTQRCNDYGSLKEKDRVKFRVEQNPKKEPGVNWAVDVEKLGKG